MHLQHHCRPVFQPKGKEYNSTERRKLCNALSEIKSCGCHQRKCSCKMCLQLKIMCITKTQRNSVSVAKSMQKKGEYILGDSRSPCQSPCLCMSKKLCISSSHTSTHFPKGVDPEVPPCPGQSLLDLSLPVPHD